MIRSLAREMDRQLNGRARPELRWRGWAVELVDGTGISMPDTDENQARYPQPVTQSDSLGFPLARVVVERLADNRLSSRQAVGPSTT